LQLGLTIPLQKFLGLPKPPYGELCDLFFCWELHKVPDVSRSTLIAVNASNRFALVFMGMRAGSWRRLDERFDGQQGGELDDKQQLFQLRISGELNGDLCRAAGFEGEGYAQPREFLRRDMERVGIE